MVSFSYLPASFLVPDNKRKVLGIYYQCAVEFQGQDIKVKPEFIFQIEVRLMIDIIFFRCFFVFDAQNALLLVILRIKYFLKTTCINILMKDLLYVTQINHGSFFQAAQIVLISLFELNTPEFTMLLGALPKTFQDGATKLLHNHLKNSSNTSVVSALVTVGASVMSMTSAELLPRTYSHRVPHFLVLFQEMPSILRTGPS